MTDNTNLTLDETVVAELRWKEFWHTIDVGPLYWKYLEIPPNKSYAMVSYGLYLVPANVARKIRLLNSPHWRTILEAYKRQNPDVCLQGKDRVSEEASIEVS